VSEKKYFHFMPNECSCLEYYSCYVGVLNTICQFDYLRIGVLCREIIVRIYCQVSSAWFLDCFHRFVFQKFKKAIPAFWKLYFYPTIRLSCLRVSFLPDDGNWPSFQSFVLIFSYFGDFTMSVVRKLSSHKFN